MDQFWKPGTERTTEIAPVIHNPLKHHGIAQQRSILPAWKNKMHILHALETHSVVIIVGETGTGKSTQIPQILDEYGWTSSGYSVVCTQPKKLAAIQLAVRVAEEAGTVVGGKVGYAVPFDTKCSSKTCIKYVTDDVLLQETLTDPLLSSYSVVMVDDAHDRSLNSDLLLGLLKKILKKRVDLKVIISSATVHAEFLKSYFDANNSPPSLTNPPKDSAVIISLQGRMHGVEVYYTESAVSNYISFSVQTALQIHTKEEWGDVLIFVPTAEDTERVASLLHEQSDDRTLVGIPLHSQLPHAMQQRVFDVSKRDVRRVIVSTAMAELSVTIPGVKYVIDSGYTSLPMYHVESSIQSTVVMPISQATAVQRAGRSGRTETGKCFRLMTESAFRSLQPHSTPDMQRVDISWMVLQMKSLGIKDLVHFDYLSPPTPELLMNAFELLVSLGAIDSKTGKLSAHGLVLSQLPVEPRIGKALLMSYVQFGCVEEMLSIAAMCSVAYPFISLRQSHKQNNTTFLENKKRLDECKVAFTSPLGDHLTLLNIFQGYQMCQTAESKRSWCDTNCILYRVLVRADELRNQLKSVISRGSKLLSDNDGDGDTGHMNVFSSCGEDTVVIRKCLCCGYFSHAAQLGLDGRYRTFRGAVAVSCHSSSIYSPGYPATMKRPIAAPEWVLYHEVVSNADFGKGVTNEVEDAASAEMLVMRDITRIEPQWLAECAPHYYVLKR